MLLLHDDIFCDQSNKMTSVSQCVCPVIDHAFHHNIKVAANCRMKPPTTFNWLCYDEINCQYYDRHMKN